MARVSHTFPTESGISVSSTVRNAIPSLPLLQIKNDVLGEHYELSVAFVGDTRAQKLNKSYRGKTYIPDVLSFPLSKKEGEIFINPRKAKKRAKEFGMSEKKYLAFIFIHGLLHLKGLRHGSTMERMERTYLRRLKL